MGVYLIVFTQKTKLDSFENISKRIQTDKKTVMLTSHELFENEKRYLNSIFSDLEFVSFGELLTDHENELIDHEAYSDEYSLGQYYRNILKRKNEIIYDKISSIYEIDSGYVCNADLGVYRLLWISRGFTPLDMDYYYFKPDKRFEKFWISEYKGKKLIFIGKLDRISYRMDLEWKHSYDDYIDYIEKRYLTKEKCQYLTTLHEYYNCQVPDSKEYDVRYIQDGYLPPNYSSMYLKYKPENVSYYAWDTMSKEAFINNGLEVEIMPFRKILTLPYVKKSNEIRKILVATSGSGDWTAQKNRSDEDRAFEAFLKIAKDNPQIQIIYRCHPTWVHPEHNGLHSIERVKEYIKYSGISNICVSSNIPTEDLNDFCVTFKRSSLDEDMKDADIVFGEHSVSMIDAALKGIPFASYNFTNRRDLFEGINRFGFPHCASVSEIQDLIDAYVSGQFINEYNSSVDRYNEMLVSDQ